MLNIGLLDLGSHRRNLGPDWLALGSFVVLAVLVLIICQEILQSNQ